MTGTHFPDGYRVVEDHDAGAQRIVVTRGLVQFICRTDSMNPGTHDGSWCRMNDDETSAGLVSNETAIELDKALRLHREREKENAR